MEWVHRGARFLLLSVGLGYVALCVLALFADRIIFPEPICSYCDRGLAVACAAKGMRNVVVVKIPSGASFVTGVHLLNPEARYTLLYSHGNAEDLGTLLPALESFRQAGFAVFAFDYRGYGSSPGKPSEAGLYQDELAAYDYLTTNLGIPATQVIAYGRSVGAAAALEAATQRQVAGLVLESPFLSAFRVLTRVPVLPWDKFPNARKMSRVTCPVLVIHGRDDQVIPFWHGERLFALATSRKQNFWVAGAGHNDVMRVAGRAYFQQINAFTNTLGSR